MQPDLEYGRSDRDEVDGNFAPTERGVQLQGAIKKISRKYGAKTVTYNQNFVCVRVVGRSDELGGQSV